VRTIMLFDPSSARSLRVGADGSSDTRRFVNCGRSS
jgi:hypothetical protein